VDLIEQAELAVVVEIFRRYPDAFVWIGGSMLRIVNHSPRTSHDVDLAPQASAPGPEEVAEAVRHALEAANPVLGSEFLLSGPAETTPDGFTRLRVENRDRPAFSVDLTRIGGTIRSTRVIFATAVTGSASVRVPDPSAALFQKTRALLSRQYPKAGDLFDVWFLLGQGAELDAATRTALADEFADEPDEDAITGLLAPFRRPQWIQSLERAGVTGLTRETGALIVTRVETYLRSFIR